jgi:hypothetical protein
MVTLESRATGRVRSIWSLTATSPGVNSGETAKVEVKKLTRNLEGFRIVGDNASVSVFDPAHEGDRP